MKPNESYEKWQGLRILVIRHMAREHGIDDDCEAIERFHNDRRFNASVELAVADIHNFYYNEGSEAT